MLYLLKGIAILLALLASSALLGAQELQRAPISKQFGPRQLAGETNIWQLAEGPNGQIIAAGERIGYYQDGQWEFLPHPRIQNIHCLLVDGDSLWISANNEIGKIALPLTRKSHYQKLEIPALTTAGELWYLARRNTTLIATGTDQVWFIDLATKTTQQAKLPNVSRLFLHSLDKKLVVTSNGTLPHEVGNAELVPLESPLPNKRHSTWIGVGDAFIFAGPVYQRVGETYREVTRLKAVGDPYLFTAAIRWDNLLVVTTFNKGLLFVELDTGKTSPVSHPAVLASLGATHAIVDKTNRLWVATTRGISVFESFRFGHAIPSRDYPLAAFRNDGLLLNYEDKALNWTSDGPPEQRARVFAVQPTKNGVAIGLWRQLIIDEKTYDLAGDSVELVVELPDQTLFVTCGPNSYRVNPLLRKKTLLRELEGKTTGAALVAGQLWVATIGGELYRAPAPALAKFEKVTSLPKNATSTLHGLGDTLVIANSESVTCGAAQIPVARAAGLRSPFLATTGDGTLWLLGEQNGHPRLGRLVLSDGLVTWETVEAKGLAQLADAHHLSASGTTLTITGADRILELNTAELKPTYRLAPPSLKFTVEDQQTGRTTTLGSPPTTLTADTNSLTFSGTLAFDEFGEKPAFERRLLPTETTWIATKHGEKVTYPALATGNYVLEVRSTHLGRTGATVSHPFVVLPAWYFSPGSFLGYISILGLAGYGLYLLRTRQIRARNQELERIVADRTRQLAEASAAKSEFVASMSHEIRNPMNGVLGLVTILSEQPAHPRQASTLRLLQSCAEQLRATVDDILDFSKIEARSITLDPVDFDLRDSLQASAATVALDAEAIVFTEQLPPDIRLRGDAAKLRQIFANYLNNALKYGIPPRARVSTILTPVDDHRLRLTLSVTSTGPTIEKEALDKLFESFTRGNDAVGRNVRGTGLGLAICKRYAEAMGGEVGAVSTNGETTFYLNLPFKKLSAPALTSADAAVANPHPTLPAHALAIEDEDYNRIVLGNILAKMNYTVDWATNGAEALALAQRRGYDIILTDYRLPDTDGVTLAKKILALVPEPKPAVFAVTAYSTKEKRDECLRAGMAGFISKPITLEKLRGSLQSWGETRLAKISLEASPRPLRPAPRDAEIETKWAEIKRVAPTNPLAAAQLTHALLGYCRNQHRIDLAEQLELLEEAWRQSRDPRDYVSAIEGFLRA